MRLSNALNEFLTAKEGRGRSPSTLEKYLQNISSFAIYTGNPDVENITYKEINNYLVYKRRSGAAPGSLHTYYRSLKTFFKWCARHYKINSPIDAVDTPSLPKRLPDFFTLDEIKKLIKAIELTRNQEKNRAILYTFLGTGMRAGELVNLKTYDIDMVERTMRVFGKDQEERLIPIEHDLCEVIKDYWRIIETHEYAFLGRGKNPLTVSGVRSLIKRLGNLAGLKRERIYTHLLRHTYAHNWLANGGDVETLRKVLGHSHINTTQIYTNTVLTDVRRVHKNVSPLGNILY